MHLLKQWHVTFVSSVLKYNGNIWWLSKLRVTQQAGFAIGHFTWSPVDIFIHPPFILTLKAQHKASILLHAGKTKQTPADFERSLFSLKLSEAQATYTFNIQCPFENGVTHLKYRRDGRNEELWTLSRAGQLKVSKQPDRHGQRWGLVSPSCRQGWEKLGGEHWTASALASFFWT